MIVQKGIAIVKMTSNRFCSFWANVFHNTPKVTDVIETYFASLRDLSFQVKTTTKNPKFHMNAVGSVSWSSNKIGNFLFVFLEPMMINSVLLGFSFSFEFVT